MKNLNAICIPSGPSEKVDLERVNAARIFNDSLKTKLPYIILGVGPDIDRGLKYPELFGIDYHRSQNNFLLQKTIEYVGVDSISISTVGNVLYGFPNQKGNYALATDEWHFKKYLFIAEHLKKRELISKDLNFIHVPGEYSEYYNKFEKAGSSLKTMIELYFPKSNQIIK